MSYIVHKAVELSALSAKHLADEEVHEYLVSPKYDGCHVIFCFDNGQHLGTYSRTGESVKSMDHIARSLFDHYPLEQGRIAICGEAWMVDQPFNVISGYFRRQSPQPQLQFVPFDIVPFDYNDEQTSGPPVLLGQLNHRPYPAPYSKRLEALDKMRRQAYSNVIAPRWYFVRGKLVDAMQGAMAYAKEHKARTDSHFDGAILARADGKYNVGHGKGGEFIKCKPLLSESVVVNAVISDLGSKTGKNTCVLCFDLNNNIQKVSTGLTQAQADEYTQYPERIVGMTIEVEAMGVTVNGLLREPRFKGIRIDA